MSVDLLVRAQQLPGGRLCAHRNGMPFKPRVFRLLTGFGPAHNLGVYHNNIDNIERAFVERYFLCQEGSGFRPALPVFTNYRTHAGFKMFQDVTMFHMPKLPRLSRQQVVDRYSGRKRKIYQAALESLARKPLCDQDSRLTSFVKFEKQDTGKAPRVINPRTPRYNLCLGQYLKHAEKPFFKAINKTFGAKTKATVIKGFNADVSAEVLLSKWNLFQSPVAIGLDASKFDMHVSLEVLMYEHAFYTRLFPGSVGRELRHLLSKQLRNTGHAHAVDGRLDFAMRGTRASGDLNTSLGNCIIMCSHVWAYARERGITLELANNGDDCVVIMDSKDESRFMTGLSEWFRDCGFAMTVETPVYEFEQLEFCQTRPVRLSRGWRMVRNHDAVLKKDPMCLVPVTKSGYRKWLACVGECGGYLAEGVPVQQQFYAAMYRNGSDYSEGFKQHVYKNTSMFERLHGLGCGNTITAEARVSYYYAFGVLPDEQVEIEKYFDSATVSDVDEVAIARDALQLEPGLNNLILYRSNAT